jgi:membrane protease YdiL (CAAX protease family)
MTSDMAAAAPQQHFRFKFLPVLTVIVLALGLPWLASEMVDFARHYSHAYVPAMADTIAFSYATHGVLLVLTLIAITATKWLVPADYGLHPPRERSYAGWALLWGALFGVALAGLRYLALGATPFGNRHAALMDAVGTLTTGDIAGRIVDQGAFVAISEETLFRALLVTFLAATMPGRWRIAGYDIGIAGVIVAVVYAFCAMSVLPLAWLTAVYAAALLVLGALYAYWLEHSKSLAAPILGHASAGIVAYAVLAALTRAA